MYIDESGNTGTDYKNVEQPYFTMSGIIIKDTDWVKLDHEISELKKDLFGTADIEIHAALMYNPKRSNKITPFWGYRTKDENWNSLEAVVDFISKSKLALIYCIIDKRNIKNHLGQDIKVDPYYFALIILSYYFDIFIKTTNDKGIIITDKIDSVDEKITRIILDRLRIESEYQINNIIERPLKTDSMMSNLVQLADVAAFFSNKMILLRNEKNNLYTNLTPKQEYILKIWKKLAQISALTMFDSKTRNIGIEKFKDLVKSKIILSENDLI